MLDFDHFVACVLRHLYAFSFFVKTSFEVQTLRSNMYLEYFWSRFCNLSISLLKLQPLSILILGTWNNFIEPFTDSLCSHPSDLSLSLSFHIAILDPKLGRMTRSCSSWFHWVRQRWVWLSVYFLGSTEYGNTSKFLYFFLSSFKHILVQIIFEIMGNRVEEKKQRNEI